MGAELFAAELFTAAVVAISLLRVGCNPMQWDAKRAALVHPGAALFLGGMEGVVGCFAILAGCFLVCLFSACVLCLAIIRTAPKVD